MGFSFGCTVELRGFQQTSMDRHSSAQVNDARQLKAYCDTVDSSMSRGSKRAPKSRASQEMASVRMAVVVS